MNVVDLRMRRSESFFLFFLFFFLSRWNDDDAHAHTQRTRRIQYANQRTGSPKTTLSKDRRCLPGRLDVLWTNIPRWQVDPRFPVSTFAHRLHSELYEEESGERGDGKRERELIVLPDRGLIPIYILYIYIFATRRLSFISPPVVSVSGCFCFYYFLSV